MGASPRWTIASQGGHFLGIGEQCTSCALLLGRDLHGCPTPGGVHIMGSTRQRIFTSQGALPLANGERCASCTIRNSEGSAWALHPTRELHLLGSTSPWCWGATRQLRIPPGVICMDAPPHQRHAPPGEHQHLPLV